MAVASSPQITRLHPVVLPVPPVVRDLPGLDKVSALSAIGAQALRLSAGYLGVETGELGRDENGAPLPSSGLYWSLSHCDTYAVAVAAPSAVGIDIERIAPCSPGLETRIADEAEWSLVGEPTPLNFFCLWTAKEAVLKAAGVGLAGLSECRIIEKNGIDYCRVRYKIGIWRVILHTNLADHVIAITDQGLPINFHAEPGAAA